MKTMRKRNDEIYQLAKVQDYDFYVTITDGFFSNQITDADEVCRSSEISVNLILIIVFCRLIVIFVIF
jgi:hypothetical protein